MSRLSRGQYILGLGAVLAVAIALRMGPLWWSPLPFNPDGIVYAGLARETIAAGELPIEGLPIDSFSFTVFIATLELVVNEPARYVSQPVIAIVGALPSLVAAVFATRLGRHLDWTVHRRRSAGLLAGAFLAVNGLYLHRSMPVDEQTIGLFAIPLVLLALARVHQAERGQWYVVLTILLLSLPPLHNLESIIALFLLTIAVFLRRTTARNVLVGGALVLGYVAYFVSYSWGVPAVTPAIEHQSGRISYAPGLLLAWLIIVAVTFARFARLQARTQRLLLTGAFSTFLAIGVINAIRPIFPGTQATPAVMLLLGVPLLVPLFIGVWALPLVKRSTSEWTALLSVIGAAFVLIGMAFTATLTPEYSNTAYRAQTFLHFPMFVLAGVGTAELLRRIDSTIPSLSTRRAATAVAVTLLLTCAAASIPIAFGGVEVLAYKGTTTEAEFAAAEFSVTHLNGSWAADDHISRVSRYFDPGANQLNLSAEHVLPVYSWVATNGPPPRCPTVTQASWTTTGAQFYPWAPATISAERLEQWERTHAVIYRNSSPDPITIGLSTNASTGC